VLLEDAQFGARQPPLAPPDGAPRGLRTPRARLAHAGDAGLDGFGPAHLVALVKSPPRFVLGALEEREFGPALEAVERERRREIFADPLERRRAAALRAGR